MGEGAESATGCIVNFDGLQGVGDFLAVGADVLHRGGAGEAGDLAKGFDTGEASLASVGDNVVPVFTTHDLYLGGSCRRSFPHRARYAVRGGVPPSSVTRPCNINTLHAIDDNDTVETFVVAESVGAVAEYESR